MAKIQSTILLKGHKTLKICIKCFNSYKFYTLQSYKKPVMGVFLRTLYSKS